jgi:hypothetical protein
MLHICGNLVVVPRNVAKHDEIKMLLLRTPRFRLPHCQKTPSFRLKYLPISSLSSTYRSSTEFHQNPCKSNAFRKSFSVFTPLFQLHKPGKSDLNQPELQKEPTQPLKDTIYTIPNLLTVSRIFSCPILGYAILQDNFYLATSLLVYAGLTDLVSWARFHVFWDSFPNLWDFCPHRQTDTWREGFR